MLPSPSYSYMRGAAPVAPAHICNAHIAQIPRFPSRFARPLVARRAGINFPSSSDAEDTNTTTNSPWYQEDGSTGETLLDLFRQKQPGK